MPVSVKNGIAILCGEIYTEGSYGKPDLALTPPPKEEAP